MEEGGEVGDGTAGGPSAIGGRGKAEISLMPAMAQVLPPCWIQFHLLSCKKQSSNGWVVALFFFSLIIGGMVALDCILNGCCKTVYHSMLSLVP